MGTTSRYIGSHPASHRPGTSGRGAVDCRWVGNKVILPPSFAHFPILAGHGTLRQYGSFGRGGIPSFLQGSIILLPFVDLILNDPRTFFPNSTG